MKAEFFVLVDSTGISINKAS